MIKYLGSKRTLIPSILDAVASVSGATTVLDLFSGTSRVGHALKAAGYRVFANDHNAYAATLARCYIEADDDRLDEAQRLIDELNALPGEPGYFTETFCLRSRFIQPDNGARIDAIRERVARLAPDPDLESILLTSLMEAADRVDSTTGLQMAYLKAWAPRSFNPLSLRPPRLLPRSPHGPGEAHQLDATDAAAALEADIAYIDPPYNQHSYLRNYHMWESLIRWDKPPVYGIACKRQDCKDRRSDFNSRPAFAAAMRRLLSTIRARTLIISFSNEGYLSRPDLESMLADIFPDAGVATIENDYRRYIGARIGIFNPQGVRVGKVSHVTNKEFVYVVSRNEQGPGAPTSPGPRIRRAAP